ncbi:MAG: peptidylprolyl isomerase [Rhodanobacteraceae bacterium]
MSYSRNVLCICALLLLMPWATRLRADTPTSKEILAQSTAAEWRSLDPAQTLVMQLHGNRRVVIELAPDWAPEHVANIKTLVRQRYFDHTSVYRVQDNFVAQWGDPDSDNPAKAKPMGKARTKLPPEFTRDSASDFEFTLLPDGDLYAPEVGFSDSLPVARNRLAGKAWLAHCYGMVGVARDVDPESGNGNTLYVPIGQAPRRLDHQLAVVGRVVEGMPWLASLPRGPEPMGVYTDPEQQTAIESIRLATSLPESQRPRLQVLRSDSASFARLVEAKRNRKGPFYRFPVGHIGLCDVPLPVREAPQAP